MCQDGTHKVQDWKRIYREKKGGMGWRVLRPSVWLHPDISGIWSPCSSELCWQQAVLGFLQHSVSFFTC